jgi:hypothetical protein
MKAFSKLTTLFLENKPSRSFFNLYCDPFNLKIICFDLKFYFLHVYISEFDEEERVIK